MIFILDDNQNNQRLNNYNISYIEDGIYKDCLTSIEKIEKRGNPRDISHLEFLKSADCIFLHKTIEDYQVGEGFLPGSLSNLIKIKEIISKEGEIIPLVLFSNSVGYQDFSFEGHLNYIPSINKNLFYERLFDFLEYYKLTHKVDLRIIAAGKNFKIKEISRLSIKILNAIDSKQAKEDLKISDFSKILVDFKLFINLVFHSFDIDNFFNQIEDGGVKIQDFKRKINNITENYAKYGENIHPWE